MRKLSLWIAFVLPMVAHADEKKISQAEVPKPVLDGVAKKYPAGKLVGFSREVEKGKTVYEVQLVASGHHLDVDVAPDGTILGEEEQISFDAAPEAVRNALATSTKYARWTVKRVERVTDGKNSAAPRFELSLRNGGDRVELVYSTDGKLLSTESGND